MEVHIIYLLDKDSLAVAVATEMKTFQQYSRRLPGQTYLTKVLGVLRSVRVLTGF